MIQLILYIIIGILVGSFTFGLIHKHEWEIKENILIASLIGIFWIICVPIILIELLSFPIIKGLYLLGQKILYKYDYIP